MRSLGGLLFCTMTLLPGPVAHAEEWWHGTFVGEGATSCENDGSIASYEAKKARYSQRECTIDKITTIRDMDGVLLDQTCPSKKAKKPVTTRELLLKLPDGRVARYPNLATLQRCPLSAGQSGDSKDEPTFLDESISQIVGKVAPDAIAYSFAISPDDVREIGSVREELSSAYGASDNRRSSLQLRLTDERGGFLIVEGDDITICSIQESLINVCYFNMQSHNERIECENRAESAEGHGSARFLVCRKQMSRGAGFYAMGEIIFLLDDGLHYLGYFPTTEYAEVIGRGMVSFEAENAIVSENGAVLLKHCPQVRVQNYNQKLFQGPVTPLDCEIYSIDLKGKRISHLSGANSFGSTMTEVYQARVENELFTE